MKKYQVFRNQIVEEDDVVISKSAHDWYRAVNALIGPITGALIVCGIMTYADIIPSLKHDLKERPQLVRVDRDELSDLVTSDGRIFLADHKEEGTIYRPLRDSDIYRIK